MLPSSRGSWASRQLQQQQQQLKPLLEGLPAGSLLRWQHLQQAVLHLLAIRYWKATQ
jgi:hypothetical protein